MEGREIGFRIRRGRYLFPDMESQQMILQFGKWLEDFRGSVVPLVNPGEGVPQEDEDEVDPAQLNLFDDGQRSES